MQLNLAAMLAALVNVLGLTISLLGDVAVMVCNMTGLIDNVVTLLGTVNPVLTATAGMLGDLNAVLAALINLLIG